MKAQGSFNRNLITLASGSLIAQAIPIAASPILTRLFTPDDFGTFALFLAITAILGSVASARYDMAIMLPRNQRDAELLAWLSGGIATAFSLVLIPTFILWRDELASILGDPSLRHVLPWLPVAVWLLSLSAILSALTTRAQQFSRFARANTLKSLSMCGVQIAAGTAKIGPMGLIAGSLTGSIALMLCLHQSAPQKKRWTGTGRARLKALSRKYKDFPKYSLWSTLANGLSVNALSLLLSAFYSLTSLGFYSLVQRVLAAPAALVGNSFNQLFYQRASVEMRESGTMLRSFHESLLRLLALSTPPFLLIYIFGEEIFSIVFGTEWQEAGRYAEILAPMFWARFWVSPLSTTNLLTLKNKEGLIANLCLLALSATTILISSKLGISIELMLKWMNLVLFVFYVAFFARIYSVAINFSKKTKS